jgi:hypothetical protein
MACRTIWFLEVDDIKRRLHLYAQGETEAARAAMEPLVTAHCTAYNGG